jgi:hypothetical protein
LTERHERFRIQVNIPTSRYLVNKTILHRVLD